MPRKRRPSGDYEVGYGKPPESTRFKSGQSGNPKGRPKGQRNLATDLKAVLEQKVTVAENGRPKTMTKRELMLVSAVNKAAKGDPKALNAVVALMTRMGLADMEVAEPEREPAPENLKILDLFLRNNQSKPGPEEA